MAVRDELLAFVQESLLRDSDKIEADDGLIERGIIDSVGLIQLLTFIEERFAVRVPDHLVTPPNFGSVSAMEEMIKELRESS